MPELPEVEIIVRGLRKNILGLKLTEFKILNKNLRYEIPKEMEVIYKNKIIKHIFRIGKYGILLLNGKSHIVFHLGMTGKFRFSKKKTDNQKHDHIRISLNNGLVLLYNDIRKFGCFSIINNPISLYNFKNLGIEPIHLKNYTDYLWDIIKKKNKDIKSLLLDQSFITGIGNIYASEILYDSKILPFKIASKINKKSFTKLLNSIEKILEKAISSGGTTIKDFQNIVGDLGYFQNSFKVYGREGLACYKCKNLIIKIKSKGRSTFFCSSCQK